MAQRTTWRAGTPLRMGFMRQLLRQEAEEEIAAAVRAGDGLGHGGEGRIDRALVNEAMLQDPDLHGRSLVGTGEDGAGGRETIVAFGGQPGRSVCRCDW